MASDGATTSGTLHQESKKLTIIDDSAIVGVSGPVGLGQRIVGELDHFVRNSDFRNMYPFAVMTQLSQIFRSHVELEAAFAQKTLGPGTHSDPAWATSTILSMPIQNQNCLIHFNFLVSPQLCTNDLPFVAIGSGQPAGDPFLAFIRRLLWKDTVPKLTMGIFTALWTLRHAILTSPGGVSEPIQVGICRKEKDGYEARELPAAELAEARMAVKKVEDSIASEATKLRRPSSPAPIPPRPEHR